MNAPAAAPQGGSMQTARASTLRTFRKNTRRRWQYFSDSFPAAMVPGQQAAVVLPQVGLASAVYLYFQIQYKVTSASPASAALPRGPFNFCKRVQLQTNLGSNLIWDTDGFNCFYNNITKDLSQVLPTVVGSQEFTGPGYPNSPVFQYPTGLVQNDTYNVNFVLRLDIANGTGQNFAQGLVNLQAPQVQASVSVQLGQASDLYALNGDTAVVTCTITPIIEYFQIPNAQRGVQLPSGALHCTLQQTQAFSLSPVQYQIPRQGILLRLQQETVIDGLLALGGSSGQSQTAGNPPTAGIDLYELQLMNSDTIYRWPWWLKRKMYFEEFGSPADYAGMDLHEFFGAFDLPARGDFRDAIDTEAVTTTTFNTYINSSAVLGSNNNYCNFTRELLIPFSMAAAGISAPGGS